MLLIVAVVLAYLIGSIPFGFLIVKFFSGKDVRQEGSGRTGGTNAMRAAGFWAGFFTAFSDIFKSTFAVWLAQTLLPTEQQPLGMVLAGLASIIGHNYSIYMKFKGGAGGAPCVGGAMAIWWPSAFFIIPICAFILWAVGYASIATLSASLIVTAIFAYLAFVSKTLDPIFIWFGVGSIILLAWSLRPNFQRLMRGEERLVGLRAKRLKEKQAAENQ